jgi:PAS domain S-box-containing protein
MVHSVTKAFEAVTAHEISRQRAVDLAGDIALYLSVTAYLVLNEAAAGRRRTELRAAVNQVADLTLVIDHHGIIVHVSKSLSTYGYDPTAAAGQRWRDVVPAQAQAVIAKVLKAVFQGERGAEGPVPCEWRQPDTPVQILTVTGVRDSSFGTPLSMLLFRDVTHERRVQASLSRVDHATAVAQLTAGITHNFNNVFGGIMLQAELLHRTEGPDAQAIAEKIARAAGRGGELCSRLMTFASGSEPSLCVVPLEPVVADAVTLVEPNAQHHCIDLSLRFEPEINAYADASQVRQILVNILLNAVEACGYRGKISITVTRSGAEARIDIANSGPPIPPELTELIFLPFFSTKTSTVTGVGLGLAVSRSLAEGMNGTLEVASPPGGPTVFTLTLPSS